MNSILKGAIGLIGGLAVGGIYAYFAHCTNGVCTANDTPAVPVLVGGAIGLFIASNSK